MLEKMQQNAVHLQHGNIEQQWKKCLRFLSEENEGRTAGLIENNLVKLAT